jgi:hypothetical protein
MVGVPVPYGCDVHGNQVTIRTDLNGGATYTGSFSADGNSGSVAGGRTRARPGNVAYDITVTRAG